MTDAPSNAAIADALDADEATLQRYLSQHSELALTHGVALIDPEDLDAGFLGVTLSDVFYTRPVSAYGRDVEGTQTSNRLREEPRLPGTPFQGETGWEPASSGAPYTVLREAPSKSLRSPRSGASALSGATSSRRRASHALK